MNIVTGYTGTPHVTANEAQALNQGIFGSENYVLDVGQKFSATLVDANNITIEDGEGVMQGVQFRIAPGETENVSISNGTLGYNRIDLICARYTKDPQTGIEAVSLVVIEGTPSASTPDEPDYNTGDILMNDSPVDFPLYKVTLTGMTPVVTGLFAEKVINVSTVEDVAAVQTKGVWGAESEYDIPLSAGTYVIITYISVTADVAITSRSMYVGIGANHHANQTLYGADTINCADIITLTDYTVAHVHCEAFADQSTTMHFSTWVKAVRV